MADETTIHGTAAAAAEGLRPRFALFHPNAKCTGGAMKMDLHPAHGVKDGCMMMTLAPQKTVGERGGPSPRFATFDWERKVCVKLDFSDICRMLQVFRGETESIEDGKGLYHVSPKYSTRIVLRHMVDQGSYSIEVYRSTRGRPDEDCSARITLSSAEAMGLALAFENSIGVICFGIPSVVPHDTSAYDAQVREALRESVA